MVSEDKYVVFGIVSNLINLYYMFVNIYAKSLIISLFTLCVLKLLLCAKKSRLVRHGFIYELLIIMYVCFFTKISVIYNIDNTILKSKITYNLIFSLPSLVSLHITHGNNCDSKHYLFQAVFVTLRNVS